MAFANGNRTQNIFTWGATLETLFLVLSIALSIYPATREIGIVLLALFAIPLGFWLYGGYLSYVRDRVLIGNEIAQGVKWVVLGFIIGGLVISVFSLPTWLIFVIPTGFAGLMVGYRILTRDEPAHSPRVGLSRVGFILAQLVILAYFAWVYRSGTWTTLDTAVALIIAFFAAVSWRRFWHSTQS